jgi:hypothetical protein
LAVLNLELNYCIQHVFRPARPTGTEVPELLFVAFLLLFEDRIWLVPVCWYREDLSSLPLRLFAHIYLSYRIPLAILPLSARKVIPISIPINK